MVNSWERFTKPLDYIQNKKEEGYHKKLVASAINVSATKDGEFLLKHLIEEFGLDGMSGCKSSEESNYISGQQDVVRYILSLIAP